MRDTDGLSRWGKDEPWTAEERCRIAVIADPELVLLGHEVRLLVAGEWIRTDSPSSKLHISANVTYAENQVGSHQAAS